MKGGYFGVPRDWLEDPTLQTRDVFSPTGAVIWLLKNAAFKETTAIAGKGSRTRTIALKRGQLSYSLRFLGEAWRWDHGRVRRFLNSQRNSGRLALETDDETGQTLITICNYDQFSGSRRSGETPDAPAPKTAVETPSETKKKESNPSGCLKEQKNARFASESRTRTRESAAQSSSKNQQGHLLMPINGAVSAPSAEFHDGGSNAKTRIPADWSLSDDDLEYARRRGWDEQRIGEEIERYRNYQPQPGKNRITWRRWVDLDDRLNGHRRTARRARPSGEDIVAIVGELRSRRKVAES